MLLWLMKMVCLIAKLYLLIVNDVLINMDVLNGDVAVINLVLVTFIVLLGMQAPYCPFEHSGVFICLFP